MQKVIKSIGHYFKTTDKLLWLSCIFLSCISVYFINGIYIAGTTTDNSRAKVQLIASIGGIIIALILSALDYRKVIKLWKIYLPIFVVLMLLTYYTGVTRGSNQAWLYINIFGRQTSLQPSEFLKISFITTFALHLNHVKDKLNKLKNIALLALHGMGHILLVLMQGDDGTAIIFTCIFVIMLIVAGLNWKYILAGVAALGVAIPIIWYKVVNPDQKMRIMILFDPSIDVDKSYQQMQGLKALGYGGITGVGFDGVSVTVPESYNDFIFTFIGQAAGLIGCTAVVIALIVISFKLIYNGNHAVDITGRMICMGLASLIIIQSIMNIGMCIYVLPVIGIPLPFLSSGGTSALSIYIGLGFALSTRGHRDVPMLKELNISY